MRNHMRKILMLVAIAAVLTGAAASPQAAPAQMMSPVLAKMEQAGRDLKTLQAGISQEKIDRTLGVKENSTGTLWYKAAEEGKERILLQYTAPIPETVSVVGDKVVIYQPKLNQVFITSRKATAGKNRSLGFVGLAYSDAASQLRDKYAVTILGDTTVDGRKVTQIQLDPKDKSDGVQGIQLWVDQQTWLPVKYFIQEKSARTTIVLSGMKPNVKIDDDRFQIDYPKSAKVVQG